MLEKTITQTANISKRYPNLKITLQILLNIPEHLDADVEVTINLSLFPQEMLDILFFKGLKAGIIDAISENSIRQPIQVKFTELNMSETFDNLNDNEVARLGKMFREIAYDTCKSVLQG